MNFKRADYMIGTAIILFLIVHALTLFAMSYYMDAATTASEADALIKTIERNPAGWAIIQLGNAGLILKLIILPTVIFGTFYILRRKGFQEIVLEHIAVMMLFAAAINVVNDGSVVLGILAQNGWFT